MPNQQPSDNISNYGILPESPYVNAVAIVKDDVAYLPFFTRAIYVGGAGDIAVLMKGDSNPVTFKAVPAGTVLKVRAAQVLSTGTTATNLVGLT